MDHHGVPAPAQAPGHRLEEPVAVPGLLLRRLHGLLHLLHHLHSLGHSLSLLHGSGGLGGGGLLLEDGLLDLHGLGGAGLLGGRGLGHHGVPVLLGAVLGGQGGALVAAVAIGWGVVDHRVVDHRVVDHRVVDHRVVDHGVVDHRGGSVGGGDGGNPDHRGDHGGNLHYRGGGGGDFDHGGGGVAGRRGVRVDRRALVGDGGVVPLGSGRVGDDLHPAVRQVHPVLPPGVGA